MDTNKTFQTDSFLLACFLLCESCNLISIDRFNPRRMQFIFEDNPKRQSLTDDFLSYRCMIEPHRFYSAQKDIKALIYQK